jgi:hypothetical protein
MVHTFTNKVQDKDNENTEDAQGQTPVCPVLFRRKKGFALHESFPAL